MYRLQEIVDSILREKTPRSMLDHMHVVMRQFGVENFILIRFSRSGEFIDKWIIGQRAAQFWINNFEYRDNLELDPIIVRCRRVVEPFFWYDHVDEEKAQRAKLLRVPEGIVVPVPGPFGCVGAEWFGGKSRDVLSKYKIVIHAIGLACYYQLQRYDGREPDPVPERLTKRETDVLTLVADGMSAAETGDDMHISPRTVEWHINKAMKKLGAKNRIQAVVLSIRDGLIPLRPAA